MLDILMVMLLNYQIEVLIQFVLQHIIDLKYLNKSFKPFNLHVKQVTLFTVK